MARWVLDASALLALIHDEPGADVVADALRDGAAISTVNLAEVAARLHQQEWPSEDVQVMVRTLRSDFGVAFLPFDAEAGLQSGALRPATAAFGLGLGDRACLVTAAALGVPALTADRIWLELALPGIEVRTVR